MMRTSLSLALAAPLVVVAAAGCGSGDEPAGSAPSADTVPQIVVTTSVWGDVVTRALGDLAEVDVLMPIGVDPHDFSPSARQAERMEDAALVVANGLGLEEGLGDVIDNVAAGGTPVFAFGDVIPPTGPVVAEDGDHDDGDHDDGDHDDGDHDDGDHDDGDHDDGDHDDHAGRDPHVWMDPRGVAAALPELGEAVVAATGLEAADVDAAVSVYTDRLLALDADLAARFEALPPDRRVLVTDHDSFGAFADRYGFEILGSVIPASTTNAEASASDLDELADVIRATGVPAIFTETTQPDRLARAVADEAGGEVEVVELYTGSLGEPGSGADSFVGMHTTNAERIVAALG
jgi:zinc/manganese transport system substrate-binding protein